MKNIDRKKFILPSVLVIVMCLTCFLGAAWAWYTAQSATKVADIEAATYGVKVEVFDAKGNSVATSKNSGASHALELTANSTYKVKLTSSGVASTGYCIISFVDHVTNEAKNYYTPAIAQGASYEFTYQNGMFETAENLATIKWENVVNTMAKDVLSVSAYWGTSEEETMGNAAVIGRAAIAKPAATTITTNWNDGYIQKSSGNIVVSANYSYTDVITIPKKGTRITFTDESKNKGSASASAFVISSWAWNEAEQKWEIDWNGCNIQGAQYGGEVKYACDTDKGYNMLIEKHSTKDGTTSITYTYITSKDNENIRLCYHSKNQTARPSISSLYSGELGTAEEIALIQNSADWLATQKTGTTYETYKSLFEGKKISVIGDSYFYGKGLLDAGANNSKPSENVWPALFAQKYNMTFNNYGISGSPISNYASTQTEPAIVDRYSNIVKNNPDILIVEGGRNDYNQNVPMDSETDKYDTKTMKGALRTIFKNLKEDEAFKDTLIIGVTCWKVNLAGGTNTQGYYSNDYGYAFMEVCEEMGIPYINAMDSEAMGVYMTNANFRGRFCIKAGDISHLNEKGMKLVLPVFEKQIYDIYNAYLNPDTP